MTVLNASTYLCPSCHSARFYQLSQEKMRRSHKGLGNIFNNIILSHEQHGWFSKYSSKHTAGSKSKLNKVIINHFSSSTFWHHWPPFFIFYFYTGYAAFSFLMRRHMQPTNKRNNSIKLFRSRPLFKAPTITHQWSVVLDLYIKII